MPRLEPGGPGLAVSPDHAWLAVAFGGKLTVIDTATREERAEIDLPFAGDTDLMLSSERLLAFVRMESATACLAYTLPTLEPVTSMELIGQAVPLAMVNERVLVVGKSGELPRIVGLAAKTLLIDPIALHEPVQFAAEAPEDRLLVGARDQLECWDPLRRRAMFRLHLPLVRPKLGGFSSKRRQLWIVSDSAAGPLEVYRFSDGRLQARAELGKRVVAVDGHADSPRLVLAARDTDKPAELVQFDLALGERFPVPLEGVATAYCVVDGKKPVLVVARDGGEIEYVALPRATPLEEAPPRPGHKRADDSSSGGPSSPLADRLAGWRNRLANEKPGEKLSETDAARARLADPPRQREEARRREEPRPVRPPMVLAPRQPPREAPPREVINKDAGPTEPTLEMTTPREERVPATVSTWGTGWRDALCAWALAALDSPGHAAPPPPVDEARTLGLAVARLGLSAHAARGLALLYGQWLLGEGDRGVPLIKLAQVIGGGDELSDDAAGAREGGVDDGDGWVEALGSGTLGQAQALTIAGGRARLREAVANFLDGRAARVKILQPAADATFVAVSSSHRVASRGGTLSTADAQALAQKLGRAIAVVRPGARATVESQLDEARIHQALPLLLSAADAESWADLVDLVDLAGGQVVLVADDEQAPEALRELTLLE